MRLNLRARAEPEVNLTSLIDVVLLLLIFFMVSTTFQRETELSVQLPEAAAPESAVEETIIEIVINRRGEYFLNGRELVNNKLITLRAALARLSSGRKDTPLVIRADARTPHQAVVTAMDAARQLGLLRLSIATAQSSE